MSARLPTCLAAAALLGALPALGQVSVSGDVPSTADDYILVPFQVAAGVAELQVDHVVTSTDASDVLDFGVWDPQGFRGWGGGNSEPVVIGTQAASRSYRPGPLPVGTWNVVVGKARVATSAHYALTVTFRTSPTLTVDPDRGPYTPSAALTTGPKWFAGDLHAHSLQSGDAKPTIDAMADLATARGLDFLEISDHNTDEQVSLLTATQARHPALLLLPGAEITTYQGHANAIGATSYVDHRMGLAGRTMDQAISDVHAQGGLFSINHPMLDLGALCIGCQWRWQVSGASLDAVEIETGGWKESGIIFAGQPIALWERYCGQGHHLAAVGGSDDHTAGIEDTGYGSPIGDPTTMVRATELSAAALVSAVKAGHTVVKLQGPADPMVDISAGADAGVGDTVAVAKAHLVATVTGAFGLDAGFRWVQNGTGQALVPVTSEPFTQSVDVVPPAGTEDRWRAEVWVDGAPRTLTSHVWLTQPAHRGCGCGASGAESVGAVVLLLALGVFRRPRVGAARVRAGARRG